MVNLSRQQNVVRNSEESSQIILSLNITNKDAKWLLLVFLFLLIVGVICFSTFKLFMYFNQPAFYKLNQKDQQKIKETRVLYKKINVKLDNLLHKNFLAYEKLTKDHISLLQKNGVANLDDIKFFDLTSIINHEYEYLDENLKQKVHNSIFMFNNETFKYELVKKLYPEVLNSLTSEQILSILNDQKLNVGRIVSELKALDIQEKKPDFESFFMGFLQLSEKNYKIINGKEFNAIIDEDSQKSKLLLLKQSLLDDILISFELNLITKLKKNNPKYWIHYIDLRECLKYFDENIDMNDPLSILKQFVILNHEFEKQLFMSSYKSGKTVLLWDGFDEIAQKYRKFVVNFISFIYQNTKNIQVVSIQMSFENFEKEDQNTVKTSLVYYKQVKLRFIDLFSENSDVYASIIPSHTTEMLNKKTLNLSDPKYEYLNKFIHHKWENLDRDLKEEILKSDLVFQGKNIKFREIEELYSDIFSYLTSDQICNILDGKVFEVGKMAEISIKQKKLNNKYKHSEENDPNAQICSNDTFWDHSSDFNFLNDNFGLVKTENLEELKENKGKQFYILTLDTPLEVSKGFEPNAIHNLKQMFPKQLIVNINREKLIDFLNQGKSIKNIEHMLTTMFVIDLKNDFETKFIKMAYDSGGVIFILDGFFETSFESKLTKHVISMIKSIYENTENVIFISSQISCTKIFEKKEEEIISEFSISYMGIAAMILATVVFVIYFWSRRNN